MKEVGLQDLEVILHYYRALGFEKLPIAFPETVCTQRSCHMKEEELKNIREYIGDCTRCRLSEKRTKLVYGEGSPEAAIMFIGEGPGEEEDRQGRPFVGKAGQLLSSLIEKMGLDRKGVYIANIVKCRPPQNR
jgi:DNA polymerase